MTDELTTKDIAEAVEKLTEANPNGEFGQDEKSLGEVVKTLKGLIDESTAIQGRTVLWMRTAAFNSYRADYWRARYQEATGSLEAMTSPYEKGISELAQSLKDKPMPTLEQEANRCEAWKNSAEVYDSNANYWEQKCIEVEGIGMMKEAPSGVKAPLLIPNEELAFFLHSVRLDVKRDIAARFGRMVTTEVARALEAESVVPFEAASTHDLITAKFIAIKIMQLILRGESRVVIQCIECQHYNTKGVCAMRECMVPPFAACAQGKESNPEPSEAEIADTDNA